MKNDYDAIGASVARNLDVGPSVDDVISVAADYFGVTRDELTGRDRAQPLASYRAVAIAACREETEASYPTIARSFAGRDHTTIIRSCRAVARNEEASTVARLICILANNRKRGISPSQGFLFS